MNLLEIYIKGITKEEEIKVKTGDVVLELVQVTATYSCWGHTETKTKNFHKSEWAKIKKDGYYMG